MTAMVDAEMHARSDAPVQPVDSFAWGSIVLGGGPLAIDNEFDRRLAVGAAIACRLRGAVFEKLGVWPLCVYIFWAWRYKLPVIGLFLRCLRQMSHQHEGCRPFDLLWITSCTAVVIQLNYSDAQAWFKQSSSMLQNKLAKCQSAWIQLSVSLPAMQTPSSLLHIHV